MDNQQDFVEKLYRFFELPQDHLDEKTRKQVLSDLINEFSRSQQKRIARRENAKNFMFWAGSAGVLISLVDAILDRIMGAF